MSQKINKTGNRKNQLYTYKYYFGLPQPFPRKILWVITSGLTRALLGIYTAYNGSSVPTFRNNPSNHLLRVKQFKKI